MNKYFVSYTFTKGLKSGFGHLEIMNYWKMSDENFVADIRRIIEGREGVESAVILNIIQLK